VDSTFARATSYTVITTAFVLVPETIAASVANAARGVLDREEAMQRRIHADPLDYESLRADFIH
jgi:hypothetical protein